MTRRSLILATALVAGLGIATAGAETRDLETTHSAQGISQVSIEVAVGDVTVEPSSDGQIHAHVHLTPRRGGFLSSLKSGERQVREARLEAEVTGSELSLTIDAPGSDHRFEATWQVEMPTDLAVKVKLFGELDRICKMAARHGVASNADRESARFVPGAPCRSSQTRRRKS